MTSTAASYSATAGAASLAEAQRTFKSITLLSEVDWEATEKGTSLFYVFDVTGSLTGKIE